MHKLYLLDTHALIFWANEVLPEEFDVFLNDQQKRGSLLLSPVSFWEISIKVHKEKLFIDDVQMWANEILDHINLRIVEPSWIEMIQSTKLPWHHKDPFDRLLITQANKHNASLITKDKYIQQYDVIVFWMS